MLYHLYEAQRALMEPFSDFAQGFVEVIQHGRRSELLRCSKYNRKCLRLPYGSSPMAGHIGDSRRRDLVGQSTAAIDWQTWSMLRLLSAATHMRPVSVP